MRKLLLISLALLVIACGQNKDRKVLKSEDGLVRITARETPLAGMSGSYNTELEYEWEGKKHVVRRKDEDSEETVMMPMRLHSIGDNLYLLYSLSTVQGIKLAGLSGDRCVQIDGKWPATC